MDKTKVKKQDIDCKAIKGPPFSMSTTSGGEQEERSPRCREIGVQSPVATDLSRKNR